MVDQYAGYGTKYTLAQLASKPLARIEDFRVGFTYYYAESLGMVPTTTIIGGVQSDTGKSEYYIIKSKTIAAVTIEKDLFEFRSYLSKGNAYSGIGASTTAPVTTLGPTTTFNG